MSLSLFRASLLRSTPVFNGSLRNISRPLGTVNGKFLVRALVPSHPRPVRDFTTTNAVRATAAKTASPKKPTTAKGRTPAKTASPKKPTTTQGRTIAKKKKAKKTTTKKSAAAQRKAATQRKTAAKRKAAAKKKAKAKEARASRILKKDWAPPFKKPLNTFAKFAVEFAKANTGDQPMVLGDQLRAASLEWKNMSEEQKAAYAPPSSELEEYSRKLAEWNASLADPVKRAKRKHRKARTHSSAKPLTLMAQFTKEQFHVAKYPAEASTAPLKVQHLGRVFANELSETDKAGLKERAWEEFIKNNAAQKAAST